MHKFVNTYYNGGRLNAIVGWCRTMNVYSTLECKLSKYKTRERIPRWLLCFCLMVRSKHFGARITTGLCCIVLLWTRRRPNESFRIIGWHGFLRAPSPMFWLSSRSSVIDVFGCDDQLLRLSLPTMLSNITSHSLVGSFLYGCLSWSSPPVDWNGRSGVPFAGEWRQRRSVVSPWCNFFVQLYDLLGERAGFS